MKMKDVIWQEHGSLQKIPVPRAFTKFVCDKLSILPLRCQYSRADHSVTVLAFEKCGQKFRIRLKNFQRIVNSTSQLNLIRC